MQDQNSGVVTLTLGGVARRGWPATVDISVARDRQEIWRVALTKAAAPKLRRLRLPAGRYTLTATTPHHLAIEKYNVVVAAKREAALGSLQFRPAIVVTGRVVGPSNSPISGVTITAGDDHHVIATADGSGAFTAELPAHAPDAIELAAAGYAPHRIKIDPAVPDLALGTVSLTRGVAVHLRIDRTAIPATTIGIAVLAADENQRDPRTVFSKTLEPPLAAVDIPAIERGDYRLLISGPSPSQRYAEELKVRDDEVTHEIRIDPITVSGDVLLGDQPLAGSVLSVQPRGRAWEEGITLDDRGAFKTDFWQKGEFAAAVFGGKMKSAAFVHERLDISADPTYWHIVIPNRRIAGKVYDKETGQPLHGVSIEEKSWYAGGGNGMGFVPVADDGSFAVEAAQPAEYELNVHAADYLAASSRFTLKAEDTLHTIDFPMERGRLVSLLVVTATGDPVANALVIDGFGDGINPNAMYGTDAAGRLDLHLRADDAKTLYIIPKEGSFAIVDVRADAPTGEAPQKVVVPTPAGDLRIHATSADGSPRRGVEPLIRFDGRFLAPPIPRFFPFANPHYAGIWTDDAGDAAFKSFPAGVYEIYACLGKAECDATLRGAPPRDPVRVAIQNGSADVRLIVP